MGSDGWRSDKGIDCLFPSRSLSTQSDEEPQVRSTRWLGCWMKALTIEGSKVRAKAFPGVVGSFCSNLLGTVGLGRPEFGFIGFCGPRTSQISFHRPFFGALWLVSVIEGRQLGLVFDGLPTTIVVLTFQTSFGSRSKCKFKRIFSILESSWVWPKSCVRLWLLCEFRFFSWFDLLPFHIPTTMIPPSTCNYCRIGLPAPNGSGQTLRIIVLGDTRLSYRVHIRLGIAWSQNGATHSHSTTPARWWIPAAHLYGFFVAIHISLLN